MEALKQIERWPATTTAAAVVSPSNTVLQGSVQAALPWASVTKLLTAYAALVAAEEGTLGLDEPAGPPGSTARHLLAHASGLPPAGHSPIARPGERRIYSNSGFEALARLIEDHADMPFAEYLGGAVLEPLGLGAELRGSPAWGIEGTLEDLATFATELHRPTLVAPETLAEATQVQFPGVVGVLPGFGRQEPNDWGLGFELRDAKSPHWTGRSNSPRTFGHFGQTGTFLWVDPERSLALAVVTDLQFGDWATDAWPRLSDAVLREAA